MTNKNFNFQVEKKVENAQKVQFVYESLDKASTTSFTLKIVFLNIKKLISQIEDLIFFLKIITLILID
jgi:hypothetical protein